jgi:hypothetical protein
MTISHLFSFRSMVATAALAGSIALTAANSAPALAGTLTTLKSGPIESTEIIRQSQLWQTGSNTYVDIPGAKVTLTLAAGEKKAVIVRFNGEVDCYGNSAVNEVGSWCSLQAIAFKNGSATPIYFEPNSPSPFAIASFVPIQGTPSNDNAFGASMEKSTVLVGPGTYEIRLQGSVVATQAGSYVQLLLVSWSFEVDTAKAQ